MVKWFFSLMANVLYMVLYRTFFKKVPYSTKKGSATVMIKAYGRTFLVLYRALFKTIQGTFSINLENQFKMQRTS